MDLGSSRDTGYQRQCAGGARSEGVVIAPLLACVSHKNPASSQLVKPFCLLRAGGKGITAVSAGPRELCRNGISWVAAMALSWMWPVVTVTVVPHFKTSLTEIKSIIPKHCCCYSTLSSFLPFASLSNSKRDPQIATFLVVFHVIVWVVYSWVFSALWGFRGLGKAMCNCVTRRINSGQLGKDKAGRQES